MRIAIVHPDLGIGGAERLIVDAAVELMKNGHEVALYTSHHDPNHSFPETKSNFIKRIGWMFFITFRIQSERCWGLASSVLFGLLLFTIRGYPINLFGNLFTDTKIHFQ